MRAMDIYIALIDNKDGKFRPALLIAWSESEAAIFKITTRYDAKSNVIRSKYYKIEDWEQAGLHRQSYVDTNMVYQLPLNHITKRKPIGKLTAFDSVQLYDFIRKNRD